MYRLCYAERKGEASIEAYFTDSYENITGTNWDKVPYNEKAVAPKTCRNFKVRKVLIDSDSIKLPCDYYERPPWSVELVNKVSVPWISIGRDRLYGGDSMAKFVTVMNRHIVKFKEDENYVVCN